MKDPRLMSDEELKNTYNETLECYYHYGYICIHWGLLALEKEIDKRKRDL